MDNLQQIFPIQRQLFKNAGEPQQLAGSCLIAFSQPRRRGRFWLVLAIMTGTLPLLVILGQSGVAG